MRSVERFGDLRAQANNFRERERPFQRTPFDVLHNKIVRADVVERADVGMVQAGDGFSFALKAFGETALNRFDGDGAIQPRVGSFVDRAHATSSDWGVDAIGAEGCSRGEVHACLV